VPWTTLSADVNFEYISSESLPEGVFLRDPSKLQLVQIRELWRHWSKRQEDDTQGLVFLKASERDVREADSSAGPSKDRTLKYLKPSDLGPLDEYDLDGLHKCPHLESPAAHAMSKESKFAFLRTLSEDSIYAEFVELLNLKDDVSVILFVSELHLKTLFSLRMERLAVLRRTFLVGATGTLTKSFFPPNFTRRVPFWGCISWLESNGLKWVPMRNLLSCPWVSPYGTYLLRILSKMTMTRTIVPIGSSPPLWLSQTVMT